MSFWRAPPMTVTRRKKHKQKPARKTQQHLRKVCEDPHEVNSPSELSPFHHIITSCFRSSISWHHMVLFHIITSFTKIFHMISMNFMQSWQNHSRASLAPPKLPSKKAPLLAIVFGPRNSRHKTPVTKLYLQKNLRTNIKKVTNQGIRSSKPALFPAWPQWNHHFFGLFFQNIISKKRWGIHWIHHLLQVMVVHLENSTRGNEFGSEFIGRFLLQKHPGDDWRFPWCSNLPVFFCLFFGFFFFRSLRFGRIQVLLIETSMCFSFFWGDPLKHTKRRRKKTCVLKKHMYVNTNGQALGESESSESCQESAMWY